MLQVRKGKRNGLHARTFESKKGKKRHRSQVHQWTKGKEMMKCTFAMMSGSRQRGTTTLYMPGYRKKNRQKVSLKERESRSGQDRNQRQTSKKNEFKKVMEDGDDKIDEDSTTIQKAIETAAGKVVHHTHAEREKLYTVRRRMSDYVSKLLRDAKK